MKLNATGTLTCLTSSHNAVEFGADGMKKKDTDTGKEDGHYRVRRRHHTLEPANGFPLKLRMPLQSAFRSCCVESCRVMSCLSECLSSCTLVAWYVWSLFDSCVACVSSSHRCRRRKGITSCLKPLYHVRYSQAVDIC